MLGGMDLDPTLRAGANPSPLAEIARNELNRLIGLDPEAIPYLLAAPALANEALERDPSFECFPVVDSNTLVATPLSILNSILEHMCGVTLSIEPTDNDLHPIRAVLTPRCPGGTGTIQDFIWVHKTLEDIRGWLTAIQVVLQPYGLSDAAPVVGAELRAAKLDLWVDPLRGMTGALVDSVGRLLTISRKFVAPPVDSDLTAPDSTALTVVPIRMSLEEATERYGQQGVNWIYEDQAAET